MCKEKCILANTETVSSDTLLIFSQRMQVFLWKINQNVHKTFSNCFCSIICSVVSIQILNIVYTVKPLPKYGCILFIVTPHTWPCWTGISASSSCTCTSEVLYHLSYWAEGWKAERCLCKFQKTFGNLIQAQPCLSVNEFISNPYHQ